MQPKVILYIAMSLDGKISGFEINKNVYKEIKSHVNSDAVFMDVETFKNSYTSILDGSSKQLLVLPDNMGKISRSMLLERSSTMNILVLCSRSTPQTYLNFLEENYINYMIVGYDEVNLATAFEELNIQFGVKTIAVHADGVLNGNLMTDDLVEEIFVFMHPILVGENKDDVYLKDNGEYQKFDLRLLETKVIEDEIVNLKYRVMKYKF
ncbi:MAG: dihydrofolate reductase family protein [Methanobacterium sp. ERen5]|nr:MAG: dihydrofolate reductase family protein [Methanobacterium sp. ERen5]